MAIVDAYTNLTRDQLVLFLSIRNLSVDGSSLDLANRLAQHDLETYKTSPLIQSFPAPPEISPKHPPPTEILAAVEQNNTASKIPSLPAEIIAEIMDHVGDWELAKAVGTVTALRKPKDWTRATLVDEAALTGYLGRMRLVFSAEPSTSAGVLESSFTKLTQVGANAIVRLGYIHILDYLRHHERSTFDRLYGGPDNSKCIPLRASASGRTQVLAWWRAQSDIPKVYGDECIDEACRHGQLDVLDWWWNNTLPNHLPPSQSRTSSSSSLSCTTTVSATPIPTTSSSSQPSADQSLSPLYMLYSEAALENASARGHIHVLKWWAQSGLPLRVGRVMDLASKMGHTDVLEWWLRSGVEVKYDHGSLEHASRNGRVDVLSWWLASGYRMMVSLCPHPLFPTTVFQIRVLIQICPPIVQ